MIYNMRTHNPTTAIRVDRGSRWGNPFVVGVDGDRAEVCRLFEIYAQHRLTYQPTWLDPLKGKDLKCWCAPQQCHAETLERLAN